MKSNAVAVKQSHAPAYHLLNIWQFLTEDIAPVEHTDFVPYDFFLFHKLKGVVKGTCFKSTEAIKSPVTTEVRVIPEESFLQCMVVRDGKVYHIIGDYFKGEIMSFVA